LGYLYFTGKGNLLKDEREAARLYKLSADQGNVSARLSLQNLKR
jgi:TPR repeat protein